MAMPVTKIIEIQTERLLLRQWKKDDLVEFSRLNADPEVMKYYPSTLTTEESHRLAKKIEALIVKRGWGFWAVELLETGSFIGFVGLHEPEYTLPVTPCVEVGWRLAKEFWGKGYATESGKAAVNYAFNTLGLTKFYATTEIGNQASHRALLKIGLTYVEDFYFEEEKLNLRWYEIKNK